MDHYSIRRNQPNFFVVWAVARIISGRSDGKIVIILSFWIGTSKNKNIDHRSKEACAIMTRQVTYETDYISLLCVIQWCWVCQNFLFYVFYCNLKEKDHIKKNINSNKKEMFIYEIIIIIIILICQKLGLVGSVQEKIKLPSPKLIYWKGVIIEPRLKAFSKVHLTFVGKVLLTQRIVNSGFDINRDCFYYFAFLFFKIPN